MPSNHLILCRPLLLLPSIFSSIRVCFNESVFHIKQPKFWNFSFSISPSNKYLALISFRIDGFDLLAVQGTLKSLLQHKSKTSVLWHSAFFYGPTLTSVHDYWKHHSSDNMVEKAMAPHSSTLAWKIPWTEEPGGLQSMGLLRVRHD